MFDLLVKYAFPALITAVTTLVCRLLLAYSNKIEADAKSTTLERVKAKALHLVQIVVSEVEQTLRPQVKEYLADGKMSEDEKLKLKATAIIKVKSYLGPDGLEELRTALGIDASAVTNYIVSLIEAQIFKEKA